ncbi:MAG TPA: hypothetical protein VIM11_21150 [Tepidisphaeraceae bacterium]
MQQEFNNTDGGRAGFTVDEARQYAHIIAIATMEGGRVILNRAVASR